MALFRIRQALAHGKLKPKDVPKALKAMHEHARESDRIPPSSSNVEGGAGAGAGESAQAQTLTHFKAEGHLKTHEDQQ